MQRSLARVICQRPRREWGPTRTQTGATHAIDPGKFNRNVFTSEQKKQIARKLTDAMVDIEGGALRGVTWVTIQEVRSGNWAIGGQPLTTADVRALAAGG